MRAEKVKVPMVAFSKQYNLSPREQDVLQLMIARVVNAEDISQKLNRRRLGAHTVQVKVRYGDFTTLTRQITLEDPVTEAREIYRLGCHLLGREQLVRRRLRLLGLGVSGLGERASRQLLLL